MFETFTPIWSHVKENEKKMAKIQNWKFHNKNFTIRISQKKKKNRKKSKIRNFENNKIISGDMVDRYLFPKFAVSSFSGILKNDVYGRLTLGRQWT